MCNVCWRRAEDDFPESDISFDEELDHCLELACQCECHDDFLEGCDLRFEGGVLWSLDEYDFPSKRAGIFPFLSLAPELRKRTYGYTFIQEGLVRSSQYHRGTIHTALLRTCRQVYKEAGNLPLMLNRPSFNDHVGILNFVGFCLTPKTRMHVTKVQLEMDIEDMHRPLWQQAVRRLKTLPITQLGVTFRGGYTFGTIMEHQCFLKLFAEFNQLQNFNPTFASAKIDQLDKTRLIEEFRSIVLQQTRNVEPSDRSSERLTNGNRTPPKSVKRTKRSANKVMNSHALKTFIICVLSLPSGAYHRHHRNLSKPQTRPACYQSMLESRTLLSAWRMRDIQSESD